LISVAPSGLTGAGAVALAPLPPSAAASTSALEIRPAGPVPSIEPRSTPSAAAARLATGETFTPSGVSTAGSCPAGRGAAVGCGVGAAEGLAPSPAATRAITWPTFTVSPAWARISATVPETGAGTSASTLSVEISTSVSSASTASPGCLAHSRITPSDTDSPIAGITTSTVSPEGTAWVSPEGAAPVSPVGAGSAASGAAGMGAAPLVAISASTLPTETVSPSAA
jgi:hypothetical protein